MLGLISSHVCHNIMAYEGITSRAADANMLAYKSEECYFACRLSYLNGSYANDQGSNQGLDILSASSMPK